MTLVVATAPASYPTPTDGIWGHAMPNTQAVLDLSLLLVSAIFAGAGILIRFGSRRLTAAVAVTLSSAVVLYLISVVAWRLHAPVSAGSGD
jgi:hypothetical protein